jgi:hypothetical protein
MLWSCENFKWVCGILIVKVAFFMITEFFNYLLVGPNIVQPLIVTLESDMGVILETERTAGQ